MVDQNILKIRSGDWGIGRNSIAPQRREQIIWALYDCLAGKGQEGVTIKEIAARAGLPNGVIHYYFDSKDEIVSSLAQSLVEKYGRMLNDRLAGAATAEDRIEVFIDFTVDELIFNQPLNRVFYNLLQMAFEREKLRTIIRDMFEDYRMRMAETFVKLRPGRNDHLIGAVLVAVTEGLSLQCMINPIAFSRDEIRKLFVEALTRLYIPPRKEA